MTSPSSVGAGEGGMWRGARSPGGTTSLVVALRPSMGGDEGARSPGETTSARVPTQPIPPPAPTGTRPLSMHGAKKPISESDISPPVNADFHLVEGSCGKRHIRTVACFIV